jgi:hypothetical protein
MRVLLQEKSRPVDRDAGNKALRRSGASLGDAGTGAAGESSQKTAAVRSDVTVNPGPPGPCRALQGGGSDAIKARCAGAVSKDRHRQRRGCAGHAVMNEGVIVTG